MIIPPALINWINQNVLSFILVFLFLNYLVNRAIYKLITWIFKHIRGVKLEKSNSLSSPEATGPHQDTTNKPTNIQVQDTFGPLLLSDEAPDDYLDLTKKEKAKCTPQNQN
jgi:hypothetical protein